VCRGVARDLVHTLQGGLRDARTDTFTTKADADAHSTYTFTNTSTNTSHV
jgi:hypothetical protein